MLGRRKGGSPERIIKYPGMDNQIKDMVTSSQVMQIKTVSSESQMFASLKRQVNSTKHDR